MKIAEGKNLKKKITTEPSKIVSPVISDGIIKDVDKKGEIDSKGQRDIKLNTFEIQKRFDKFIYDNCSPYAPADSSDRMKTAIYQFFKEKYKLQKYDPRVQRIVMGKENVQAFVDIINLSKEKYKTDIVEQINEKREKKEVPKWEVPLIVSYNSRYKRESHPSSIMKPFYTRKPSTPEQLFMELLDNSDKIEWWFKNGESEIIYFAVPYKDENGLERAFYVDFVVKFKDGTIGLFDTKGGMTAKDAGTRAKGLQQYIKKNKTKKVWGGIVIESHGSWRLNDKEKYEYNPNDLSSWKVLEI